MNIAVVGAGYVGYPLALLLAQNHRVVVLDKDEEKVNRINNDIPVSSEERALELLDGNIAATTDPTLVYPEADIVFVAVPTDFSPSKKSFNTKQVDEVIEDCLDMNPLATIVIRSTVPIGYTRGKQQVYGTGRILFCPEFLREGHAFHDNLYPSRIVIGGVSTEAQQVAELLRGMAEHMPTVKYTNSDEAEAIKLFSNMYLAARVAFFNELDTYAEKNCLNAHDIIAGIGLDTRIGLHYNNPSFGYGGYCLPKDSKYLATETKSVFFKSVISSNIFRKEYIFHRIMAARPKTVGFYRLSMKTGSDNCRESASVHIAKRLIIEGVSVIVYEPSIDHPLEGVNMYTSLELFKKDSDIIMANRIDHELDDVMGKVYTRDIFHRN